MDLESAGHRLLQVAVKDDFHALSDILKQFLDAFYEMDGSRTGALKDPAEMG